MLGQASAGYTETDVGANAGRIKTFKPDRELSLWLLLFTRLDGSALAPEPQGCEVFEYLRNPKGNPCSISATGEAYIYIIMRQQRTKLASLGNAGEHTSSGFSCKEGENPPTFCLHHAWAKEARVQTCQGP
ncbi:hypothetical protein PoB_005713100 [Plakobranchus ocellatus]|uniref:Uncharacterized protein n=1 Tax=Plakobranchus ocellatus TaxID=259542 RepID=A0AAV4C5N4_9GAST|nr:hypothetical protein PoB_005713100 [Plakobranchus ocellatus]